MKTLTIILDSPIIRDIIADLVSPHVKVEIQSTEESGNVG